jgi:hypothetical protein
MICCSTLSSMYITSDNTFHALLLVNLFVEVSADKLQALVFGVGLRLSNS